MPQDTTPIITFWLQIGNMLFLTKCLKILYVYHKTFNNIYVLRLKYVLILYLFQAFDILFLSIKESVQKRCIFCKNPKTSRCNATYFSKSCIIMSFCSIFIVNYCKPIKNLIFWQKTLANKRCIVYNKKCNVPRDEKSGGARSCE